MHCSRTQQFTAVFFGNVNKVDSTKHTVAGFRSYSLWQNRNHCSCSFTTHVGKNKNHKELNHSKRRTVSPSRCSQLIADHKNKKSRTILFFVLPTYFLTHFRSPRLFHCLNFARTAQYYVTILSKCQWGWKFSRHKSVRAIADPQNEQKEEAAHLQWRLSNKNTDGQDFPWLTAECQERRIIRIPVHWLHKFRSLQRCWRNVQWSLYVFNTTREEATCGTGQIENVSLIYMPSWFGTPKFKLI